MAVSKNTPHKEEALNSKNVEAGNHSTSFNGDTPSVTIGVPAYNEERFLAATIDSLLAQSFTDFELIISDNISTDATAAIAREYEQKDKRIRYIRQPRNIGSIQNINSLIKQARGEFFLLAGAHDLLSENYISSLIDALNENPKTVLAYGKAVWIDKNGQEIDKPSSIVDTSGMNNPVRRFNMAMWSNQHSLYGLIRLDALRKTHLLPENIVPGAVLVGELSILGCFVYVPEATWYRRVNRKPENREERINRYFSMLFSRTKKRLLPHWRIPFAYIYTVLTIPLKRKKRLRTRVLLVLSSLSSVIRYWGLIVDNVKDLFCFRKG